MSRPDEETPGKLELVLLSAVAVLAVAVLVILLHGVALHRSGGLSGSDEAEVTIHCESVIGVAFPWGDPGTARVESSTIGSLEKDERRCADHRTGRLGVAVLLGLLAAALLVWQTQLRTWRLTGRPLRQGRGSGRIP